MCCSCLNMLYTLYFVGLIALSVELPVIQLEYRSVTNEEGTVAEIFMNGVTVTPNGDGRSGAFDLMPPANESRASLRNALQIIANRFNNTDNHTYQRRRKCKFNGHQWIHVSDKILYNGKDFLSLDQTTDTWTVLDPQAFFLKREFDRDYDRTVQDRVRLQEACTGLLKELSSSQSVPKVPAAVLTPLLAVLVLLVMGILSFFISKYGGKGSAQPVGGVLGSLIHYPAPTSKNVGEPVKQPSHSGKASLLRNMP